MIKTATTDPFIAEAERASQWDQLPDLVWIDLDNPTAEEEKQVFEDFFRVHPLTLEDVRRPSRLQARIGFMINASRPR